MSETTGEASIDIGASPDAVWAILTDLSRMSELSPECYKAEWEGGASEPAAGAVYHGYNRAGGNEWDTIATVTAAVPGREWEFEVPTQDGGKSIWRYEIEAADDGCRVTESFDSPIIASEFFASMEPPRVDQLRANIANTLSNLKRAAEAG